jgi:carbonic anhydrase
MKWILIFSLALCVSCAKKTTCTSATKGKIKNLTGLDGCGWVIEANGKTFEPINLNDFDSTVKKNNQKIYFTYQSSPAGSICMVGETIQLLCVNKR